MFADFYVGAGMAVLAYLLGVAVYFGVRCVR
jgi:hypothetical protein